MDRLAAVFAKARGDDVMTSQQDKRERKKKSKNGCDVKT
jgi:hypothetical protein